VVNNNEGRDGVLERNASVRTELAPPGATPTFDQLPRRLADFATIGEALDYAAKGCRGLNFHDTRGTLALAYSFAELRTDALVVARRFIALGIKPGDRIALVAETGVDFAACFFGAIYAGAARFTYHEPYAVLPTRHRVHRDGPGAWSAGRRTVRGR
jgi:fatty-acyl-CoA synthase